jgi:hypothetical protein
MAETTLANERYCLETAERGKALGETALADLLAAQAMESALTMVQVTVLADLVLPEHFMAHYHRCATQH